MGALCQMIGIYNFQDERQRCHRHWVTLPREEYPVCLAKVKPQKAAAFSPLSDDGIRLTSETESKICWSRVV